MRLKKGRFDHLTHDEAIALLRELEGPMLEWLLSQVSSESSACDVPGELFFALQHNPELQMLFITDEELESWDRFKHEHGEGAKEIGEFVYGPDENPWS